MSPVRALNRPAAHAALLSALFAASAAAWAADTPHLKPVKLSTEAAKAVKPAADDHEPAAAASAPAPLPDPLDQLRQRLAGKLGASKVSEGSGPYDVRVVAKAAVPEPAVAHAAHAPAKAAAKAGGHGAAPAAAGTAVAVAAATHGGAAHWSYQGAAGPQTWGGLKPEFSLCSSGQRQSPIDIRGGLAVDLDPVKFTYADSRFGVIDNGHTVQANIAPGNSIEIGGKRYDLVQFHFHRPSEERIDGRQFELSVHLVHKDDQGKLAVVAILMDKGQPQPVIQKVWNNLPLEKNEEAAARVGLNLQDLLPADRRYFTYMGSLTTPPCSEDVRWVVMRQPVTMSPEQIDLFARMYPMNARPVQQASGRRILQSQ
jgi:carbonic anhydrase